VTRLVPLLQSGRVAELLAALRSPGESRTGGPIPAAETAR
jgi:virginiamycin A acetyltransferase